MGERGRVLGRRDGGTRSLLHERPSALRRRRGGAAAAKRTWPRTGGRARRGVGWTAAPTVRRPRERPKRMEGVVGDGSLPRQVPERVDRFGGVATAGGVVHRSEERGATRGEVVEDRPFSRREFLLRRRAPEAGELIRQIEGEAAVALAERLEAPPDHLARRNPRVEV